MARRLELSFFKHCRDNKPQPWVGTMAELVKVLEPVGASKDGPALVGATFSGSRAKANIKAVHFLTLDIDDADGTIAGKYAVRQQAVLIRGTQPLFCHCRAGRRLVPAKG